MRAPKSDAQVSSIVEGRVVHVGGRCSLSDRVNPYRLPAQPLPIWYRTAVSISTRNASCDQSPGRHSRSRVTGEKTIGRVLAKLPSYSGLSAQCAPVNSYQKYHTMCRAHRDVLFPDEDEPTIPGANPVRGRLSVVDILITVTCAHPATIKRNLR